MDQGCSLITESHHISPMNQSSKQAAKKKGPVIPPLAYRIYPAEKFTGTNTLGLKVSTIRTTDRRGKCANMTQIKVFLRVNICGESIMCHADH